MNVTTDGKTLTITVPLSAPRPSSTGKTNIVYTSGGFTVLPAPAPAGMKVNLTVTTPAGRG